MFADLSPEQYDRLVTEDVIACLRLDTLRTRQLAEASESAGVSTPLVTYYSDVAAEKTRLAVGLEKGWLVDKRGEQAFEIDLSDEPSEAPKKATTLYVAGPMTGYDLWNFPAFHDAAKRLRAAGYNAIDPAELDLQEGFAAETKKEDLSPSMLRGFLARDLRLILEEADGIALLPGWEASKGAAAEVATARAVGMKVEPVQWWLAEASLEDLTVDF